MNRDSLQVGDEVYIRASITKLPEQNENMFRCITENQEVIWCTENELAWRGRDESKNR